MWYKVKYTSEETLESGKVLHTLDYYLVDATNFAEAGYSVMKYHNGIGDIEDVCLMKSYKPVGNEKYADTNKVFIVKFAEDFTDDNGKIKTIKYPVPFYANNNTELQKILSLYIEQGLQDMRVTTVSETKWEILSQI